MTSGDSEGLEHPNPIDKVACHPGAEVIDLCRLPAGARPIPFAPLDYDEVPQARELDCGEYGRCLEFVARVRWSGFSCRRCPFSQTAGVTPEHEAYPEPRTAAIIQLASPRSALGEP